MLHAIYSCKSKAYRRYLGEREGIERRVSEEDEITSIILGPLDFLKSSDVYLFWKNVLKKSGCNQNILRTAFPESFPEKSAVSLWPSRRLPNGEGRIEPDAKIVFSWPDNQQLILLLELKWRAALSGHSQLHRQWHEYLSPVERSQSLHIFIAPDISIGSTALISGLGDVWLTSQGSRLVLLPWLSIRSVLADFTSWDSAIGRWAIFVDSFLDKIGIRKFNGFEHLSEAYPLIHSIKYPLFWCRFSGLEAVASAITIPEKVSEPIFFKS